MNTTDHPKSASPPSGHDPAALHSAGGGPGTRKSSTVSPPSLAAIEALLAQLATATAKAAAAMQAQHLQVLVLLARLELAGDRPTVH